MGDQTLSDIGERVAPPRETRLVLTLVVQGSDLTTVPSRHRLDGIDAVVFGRGPRSAIRDEADGLRRLVLRVPDPFMSSDHGRLLRARDRWIIEDPSSKNGVVVAGRTTRVAPVEIDDSIEVGHTVFLFERVSALDSRVPADQHLVASEWSQPMLASFHSDLVAGDLDLARVAPSAIPVLFYGETGTGKEVYADALHIRSARKGPLIAVNCGALTPSLLEAELFGHRKGAFSGATADRPGFVRSADGGTLFLDEVTELSPAGQVALLRVLQEGEVVAVGDNRPMSVDVRVCAASQRPLLEAVDAGRFRSDLYARLLGYELRLPALRERIADLGYVITSLLSRHSVRPTTLTPSAIRALINYAWPRNIRELERCLATALVLTSDSVIDIVHLPAAVRADVAGRAVASDPLPAATENAEDATLRSTLAAKLVEHNGNVSAVARDMKKHREQIQRWIRRFEFDLETFRRNAT